MPIIDNHNRVVNYARIALIDKCNLRCQYCMPDKGLNWIRKNQLFSILEIQRLLFALKELEFAKLRFTGGEPFLREDVGGILYSARNIFEKDQIHITTNGTLLHKFKDVLKEIRPDGVNFSLDSLDPARFEKITRRNQFKQVIENLFWLLDEGFKVKINAVIMKGKNEEDLYALADFAKNNPIDVRFIEEMPFNGATMNDIIDYKEIHHRLLDQYPELTPLAFQKSETSQNYEVPGFKGRLGIIAAYSRTFCGTCNRLRITPNGQLKTCLYDSGRLSLIDFMRTHDDPESLQQFIIKSIGARYKNGLEAELDRNPVHESMATIGG